jgi:sialate O-acetylesterase
MSCSATCFLCSGQSNMELDLCCAPAMRAPRSAVPPTAPSACSPLRMTDSPVPLSGCFMHPLAWQIAAPDTVPSWSAACFFFARELQRSMRVPIGLLQASWGGCEHPAMDQRTRHCAPTGPTRPGLNILQPVCERSARRAAPSVCGLQWEQWWRSKTGRASRAVEPWGTAQPARRHRRPTPDELAQRARQGSATGATGAFRRAQGLHRPAMWYRTTITLTAAQAASAATLVSGRDQPGR